MLRRWLPALALLAACKVRDPPPVTAAWSDTFGRGEIGLNYDQTGPGYRIEHGALVARGAARHPLWLRKQLPDNVRIELDAWTGAAGGELEVEVDGDGKSYAPGNGRSAGTGYELVLAGGRDPSLLARLDARGKDVVQRTDPAFAAGQHTHWKIERTGRTIRWYVNDMQHPFLSFVDPHPLEGTGHAYFGFDDARDETWFDNLAITPL